MLTLTEKTLFALAVVFSTYGTFLGFSRVARAIGRGRGEPLEIQWRRALPVAVKWLTMQPIWKTRRLSSTFHAMIAWGFVFYILVNVGDVVEGYRPGRFLGELVAGDIYRLLADVLSAFVLVGMTWFVLRRFLFGQDLSFRNAVPLLEGTRQRIRTDSLIVAAFIFCHVGFRLIGKSIEIHAAGQSDPFQPFAAVISPVWSPLGESALAVGHHLSWWIALGLILCFAPYFPYTKHFHLIMAGVNFFTRDELRTPGAVDVIDFEDESLESYGALHLEDLPRRSLADAFACIMCNRCQDACPAYETGKELSPSALEINKRLWLNQNLVPFSDGAESQVGLLDLAMSESALWACTTCGACVDICPVGNEPLVDILELRRGQVLTENTFPSEFEGAWRGMERNGNPWNFGSARRMDWAEDLGIPTIEDNPDAPLLWWVGCAPSYDSRAQKTARALVKVLRAADIDFAVLGHRERCSGDTARRSGNEYLFTELAAKNVETLLSIGPRRILTTCPHCLHVLGREYRDFGGSFDVIHHTQLIAELVGEGKLETTSDAETTTVTFHDPCYLGRHGRITEAPREALHALPVLSIEMPRRGMRSFCCGAGGGQMWKEEEPGRQAVSHERYREAAETGAETLAVGCPFCLTMLEDASKSTDGPLRVKDVAELYAERL